MTERNTRIRSSQISAILPDDIEATNGLTDTYVPSYDLASGKFKWLDVMEASTTLYLDEINHRVGILLASPSSLFSIDANKDYIPHIRFENPSVNADASISTYADSTGTLLIIGSNAYINSGGAFTRFDASEEASFIFVNRAGTVGLGTGGTGGDPSTRLFLLSTGEVGIGTITPTALLEIESINNSNKKALLIEQLDTTNNPICAEINNDATGYGLYIHQDGVLANSNDALRIYSNTAQVNDSNLLFIYQDNASATSRMINFENDGTGDALRVVQNGVLASTKRALYVYSNAVQVNSPLIYFLQNHASATADVLEIDNNGTGHGLYIHQDGVLATNHRALYVYSDVSQTSSLILFRLANGDATGNLLYMDNDGTGSCLNINQDGNLASGKYLLYLDNNGTPADGAGRCIRLDGCTISSSKNPENDAEAGFIAVNIDGTQMAIPYYTLA